MSNTRLPTLKSLTSFEATARLGTINQAAEELHITHSAVSQNIKQLEGHLGHPLFSRKGRNLQLTDNAMLLLQEIRSALHTIRDATHAFKLREEPENIVLKMVSTLALRWFIPKLPEFTARYPGMKLRLVTEPASNIENLPEEVDAAIGIGSELEFAGLHHSRLCPSELVLVGLAPTSDSAESALASQFALYVESARRTSDWSHWCTANNIPEPPLDRRISLPTSAQALEAVSAGGGILVTQKIFVEQLIQLGHLEQIGESTTNESEGYYFYCKSHCMERPAIRTLHDWIIETSTIAPT